VPREYCQLIESLGRRTILSSAMPELLGSAPDRHFYVWKLTRLSRNKIAEKYES
jgi:hypothetical protein